MEDEKIKKTKPKSAINAQKARDAKNAKYLERQAIKNIPKINSVESDSNSDEEVIYIPTKKKVQKTKLQVPVNDYKAELDELRKQLSDMKTVVHKPEPAKVVNPNQEIVNHIRHKLLNF
jgi:hypothetical protein